MRLLNIRRASNPCLPAFRRTFYPTELRTHRRRWGRQFDKSRGPPPVPAVVFQRGTPVAALSEFHHRRRPMSDDHKKPGGQDRSRINVNEDYELRDWAKKFGVTTERLKAAVRAVG